MTLWPFKVDGLTIYMTLRSAHQSGIIGCWRYQGMKVLEVLWTLFVALQHP